MNLLQGIRDYWVPVLTASRFESDAVLTPEEFVAAGDYLVFKCSTWTWESGDPDRRRSYLPKKKQFLVSRSVPCLPRNRDLQLTEAVEEADTWYAIQSVAADPDFDLLDDVKPDLAALAGNVVDDCAAERGSHDVLRTRTYDLSIVYDKYYQTPRLLLQGYDENRQPLPPESALRDISSDHARKTVTLENHPHACLPIASIHPCRHAEAIKRIMKDLTARGKTVRADQYLVLFLKLMSSVLPTIDYDHTISLD